MEDEGEEDEHEEDQAESDSDEDEVELEPSGKITRIVRGQKREYSHVKTVQSFEELDTIRFKVNAKI
jgi:hypothetical protein